MARKPFPLLAVLLLLPLVVVARDEPVLATFSIVAYDPATGDVGVAVESKFFSVGPVVPWVEAGVGAIATQAAANTTYGPRGLALLRLGLTPEQAGKLLTESDEGRARRQLGIVDVKGNAFSFTGERCNAWAGGRTGKDPEGRPYAVQGNILTGEEVVLAMEQGFLSAPGELADKLVAALAAGQAAGGDSRGQQSAALVVMRPKGGYAGLDDRYLDLRVEDHPRPIDELKRLLGIRHAMRLTGEAFRAARDQKTDEAWALLEKALAAAPEHADTLYAAARFQARAANHPVALDYLRRAVAGNPLLKSAALRDNSFAALREDPAFLAIVNP